DQARDAPVEDVHDHRDEDRQRGLGVPAFDGGQRSPESAEEVPRREQAREQEDPLAPPLTQLVPATAPRSLPVPSDHSIESRGAGTVAAWPEPRCAPAPFRMSLLIPPQGRPP